ncbi:MAG: bifunctional riboflavin kinase/FMN adenylyltransferase [Planctomycetota bacterium]
MQAAVIGNFDGFHLGHRRLFELAREAAPGGRVSAVTFEPLPAAVLSPGRAPIRLTNSAERAELLRASGLVDEVVELTPDATLLGRGPEEFVDWLRERVPFAVLVEGPDFRFGKGRAGSVETLRELGRSRGFRVVEATPVRVRLGDGREVEVRSSTVRTLVAGGEVADAARVLGRPYELRCLTARGDQRGRTIGWPTANLDACGRLLPADGVYAGRAVLPDGREPIAAISVGTKPTFGESARTCEATVLAPDGSALALPLDWYGWELRLRFHARVRGMVRFESLDALLAAMEGDRAAVLRAMGG